MRSSPGREGGAGVTGKDDGDHDQRADADDHIDRHEPAQPPGGRSPQSGDDESRHDQDDRRRDEERDAHETSSVTGRAHGAKGCPSPVNTRENSS